MILEVQEIILLVIRWAHALAAVTWIGGSLFMLFAARPAIRSLREELGDSSGLVGRALAVEFRPIVLTAIGVLIISGVILAASRLTSGAVGTLYFGVLIAKVALSVYAFAIALRLRRANRPDGGVRGTLFGPVALTIAGVLVIGLADVLTWLFERGLLG